jgi:hypothetical protein
MNYPPNRYTRLSRWVTAGVFESLTFHAFIDVSDILYQLRVYTNTPQNQYISYCFLSLLEDVVFANISSGGWSIIKHLTSFAEPELILFDCAKSTDMGLVPNLHFT